MPPHWQAMESDPMPQDWQQIETAIQDRGGGMIRCSCGNALYFETDICPVCLPHGVGAARGLASPEEPADWCR